MGIRESEVIPKDQLERHTRYQEGRIEYIIEDASIHVGCGGEWRYDGHIEGGAWARGARVWVKCNKCGQDGRIPDANGTGRYSNALSEQEWKVVMNALAEYRAAKPEPKS